MLHRERVDFPDYVYPADDWRMSETKFYPRYLPAMETIFALANGYFGIRGSFEEGTPINHGGAYINGFYESWPINYPENAFGYARTGQTIVEVPNPVLIKLYIDDEPFSLSTGILLSYRRSLNMKEGTLDRELVFETPSGSQVQLNTRRLVSLESRHLGAIFYEIKLLNTDASLIISSELTMPESGAGPSDDPRKSRSFAHQVLIPQEQRTDDKRLVFGYQTAHSQMTLGCGIDHRLATECSHTSETIASDNHGKVVFSISGKVGVPIRLTKTFAYHTSRRLIASELCDRAERTLERGCAEGFECILSKQLEYMADFWHRSDITIKGDAHVQQGIRFNLFQLCQATARAEGSGVPAKGLTGPGYEGHYFWDTEIYVMPFLTYTNPGIAKNLLRFRHSYIDKARQRAIEVNQKGALFPWRTINGEEASAYYAAGTAQYHINADIVYALRKYVDATGDEEFLFNEGAEMLVETARLWVDLGFYSQRKDGKFCIQGVTGPDEYNTVVNNNAYTNLMARENLWYAARTIARLKQQRPDRFAALADGTKLDLAEIDAWRHAADNMYVPYDEKLAIHLQDDDFLDRKEWDFENTPLSNYPLLLHYHPLVIYRHQVIKQADIILAMFLLSHEFSLAQKKSNFDFYDPLTTGDSSLSACIQSIVAAEVGYAEKARRYARHAGLMDLADIGGNVRDGCHIASMGGFWMAMVYGFAGMRDTQGVLSFRPRLAERTKQLHFALTIRGQRLEVHLDNESRKATYLLQQGQGLTIMHEDREIPLAPGKAITLDMPGSGAP